jgi:hypothetical protein
MFINDVIDGRDLKKPERANIEVERVPCLGA